MEMRHLLAKRSRLDSMNYGMYPSEPIFGGLEDNMIEYSCDMCEMKYEFPSQLTQHQRTHSDSRPHVCTICLKSFVLKENLSLHYMVHTRAQPFECELCGKLFEHSAKLDRHMKSHAEERLHHCRLCDRSFVQRSQLAVHMKSHAAGRKSLDCSTCLKSFSCPKQLKVHQRTHTGEKPFKCELCDKSFGYNHVLKLHQVQHFSCRVYKCTICNATYQNKKLMEQHVISHESSFPRPSSCGSSSNQDSLDRDYPAAAIIGQPAIDLNQAPLQAVPGLLPSINSIYLDEEEVRQLPRPEPRRLTGVRGCPLPPVTFNLIDSLLEEDHREFGNQPVLVTPSLQSVLALTAQDEPINLSLDSTGSETEAEEKSSNSSRTEASPTPPSFANMKSSCLPPRKRRLLTPEEDGTVDPGRISVIQFAIKP